MNARSKHTASPKPSLQNRFPDIAAQWHPTKNGSLKPEDVTPGANQKAWWLCEKGHAYQALVNNRTRGSGCPYCSGAKVLAGFNDMATLRPELAAMWDTKRNEGLTPRDVTLGSSKKVWWRCANGHAYERVIAQQVLFNRSCPGCRYIPPDDI